MNVFWEAAGEMRSQPKQTLCFSIMSGRFHWRILFLNQAKGVFCPLTLHLTITLTLYGFLDFN